ncbi:hypothetical protein ACFORH_42820, partial [Amycolatopsis roodepoortensis]
GAGTNGPPTKPIKKKTAAQTIAEAPKQWMSASDCADASPRHHNSVLLALRRGLLVGSQSGPKGTWLIERGDFDAWLRDGAKFKRTA